MKIFLENIRLFGYHGVMSQERKVGNEFRFDLAVTYPFDSSEANDSISSTISYADIYEIIKEENAVPRQLLETLAHCICHRIRTSFPQADKCLCRITKLAPPIPGIHGHAGVEYDY